MTHSGKRLLPFVDFRLDPEALLGVKDVDVVNDSFFVVTLAASENDEIV